MPYQIFINGNRHFGLARPDVGRTIAFPGERVQSKLADQKNIAIDVFQRNIHQTIFIVKNAQVDDLVAQPHNIIHVVRIFNPDEYEKAMVNFGVNLSLDSYARPGYALNDGTHSSCWLLPACSEMVRETGLLIPLSYHSDLRSEDIIL